MPHVLDLKKKKPEPTPPPPPIVQHPVVREQKILTDTGQKLPFETLKWRAPAAYRREGSKAPYVFALFLLIVAAFVAIFQRDLMSTMLFGLLGIMVIVYARRALPLVNIEVSPVGVKRENKTYRFTDIASFWVHYEPEYDVRELSIQMKRWTSPYIKIQLADQDPVQLRSLLLQYIPEVRHEEAGLHALVRLLGL